MYDLNMPTLGQINFVLDRLGGYFSDTQTGYVVSIEPDGRWDVRIDHRLFKYKGLCDPEDLAGFMMDCILKDNFHLELTLDSDLEDTYHICLSNSVHSAINVRCKKNLLVHGLIDCYYRMTCQIYKNNPEAMIEE